VRFPKGKRTAAPRGGNFITYIFYQNTAAIETVKTGKTAFLTNLNPLPLIVFVK